MAALIMPLKAVTAREMIEIENRWFDSGEMTVDKLMERVGKAISDWLFQNYRPIDRSMRVLALIGKGNNGGDALVAAKYLSQTDVDCVLALCLGRSDDDHLLRNAVASGAKIIDLSSDYDAVALETACADADIILDGVFGFSISRPIDNRLGGIFRTVKASGSPVVGIDLPSGADPDTGRFDPNGLPSDTVLSVGVTKIGHAVRFGDECYGKGISVLDVGMPYQLSQHISHEVIDADMAKSLLPSRKPNRHKGDFGRAIIYAGSENYVGAALMATRSCLRSGVGLTALATPENIYQILAAHIPEATFIPLSENQKGEIEASCADKKISETSRGADALLVGPGIGQSPSTTRLIRRILRKADSWRHLKVVMDADALNIAASTPDWWRNFDGDLIVTPHPGEMSRLMDCSIDDVENDRLDMVKEAARRFNCVIVLKGASTLVADPHGRRVRINMAPNDGLARGGSGDVLAGLITGLAAQIPAFDAATLGVYLHSIAGKIARKANSAYSMTASDVIEHIPDAYIQLAS